MRLVNPLDFTARYFSTAEKGNYLKAPTDAMIRSWFSSSSATSTCTYIDLTIARCSSRLGQNLCVHGALIEISTEKLHYPNRNWHAYVK